jgi:fructose-1,6-bisphosphatase/inositol monophosphatase family enzyme
MDLKELAKVAINAVKAAGEVIKEAADEDIPVQHKKGGSNYASQVVTEIDRKCDGIIRKILESTCEKYDLAILTEEQEDDGSRFQKQYFWCVDPLDGTLAFINKEQGFSVSIALVSKDGKPVIGVVYNPSNQLLYHAIHGNGVFKNGKLWKPIKKKDATFTLVTPKPLQKIPNAEDVKSVLDQKVKFHQSTLLKEVYGKGAVWNAIRVLEESPACMIKPPKSEKGGGSLWDYAATACIFNELGFQAIGFDGMPLELNKKSDTFMNHQGVLYYSDRQ